MTHTTVYIPSLLTHSSVWEKGQNVGCKLATGDQLIESVIWTWELEQSDSQTNQSDELDQVIHWKSQN